MTLALGWKLIFPNMSNTTLGPLNSVGVPRTVWSTHGGTWAKPRIAISSCHHAMYSRVKVFELWEHIHVPLFEVMAPQNYWMRIHSFKGNPTQIQVALPWQCCSLTLFQANHLLNSSRIWRRSDPRASLHNRKSAKSLLHCDLWPHHFESLPQLSVAMVAV